MAIKDLVRTKKCLFICNGGSCLKANSERVTEAIRKEIKNLDLDDDFHTIKTRCMGRCDDAPVAMIVPDNIWLQNLDKKECESIVKKIQVDQIKSNKSFLYQFGDKQINSDSIPTKYRKKLNKST